MKVGRKVKHLLQNAFFQIKKFAVCFILLLSGVVFVCSQQFPFHRYDLSDGLANGIVTSVYQDSKGYIWLTTLEGLSRFDGYDFVNYGAKDGLGQAVVNHVTEDHQNRLWVATNGSGVALFTESAGEKPGKKFKTFPITYDRSVADWKEFNNVNRIVFDSNNNIFALTNRGLYRALTTDENLNFKVVKPGKTLDHAATLTGRNGSHWFGLSDELLEIRDDRIINHGPVAGENSGGDITGIAQNPEGKIYVAVSDNLFEFVPANSEDGKVEWRRIALDLKPKQRISHLLIDSSGDFFIGTASGLIKLRNGREQTEINPEILGGSLILALAEDSEKNLWVGTYGEGVFKLGTEMFVSYPNLEGFNLKKVFRFFEDESGVKAITGDNDIFEFRADGVKQNQALKNSPGAVQALHISFRDNEWWAWSNARIENLKLRLRNGRELPFSDLAAKEDYKKKIVFFEDENGRLWLNKDDGKIYRADTGEHDRLHFESFDGNVHTLQGNNIVSDGAGGIWITAWFKLCRVRQDKFSCLEAKEGLPETNPRALFVDSRGWLWIGQRYSGVSVTKERAAENPAFTNYSTQNGLLSDTAWDITEDEWGRIYIGTNRGLSRFVPQTGSWQHFSTTDGLAGGAIRAFHKDWEGKIWIATSGGVTILNPSAEQKITRPPPVFISRIVVGKEDLHLPEFGARQVPFVELSASRNNIRIDFVGLHYQNEDSLTYQYKLEETDPDWSEPTKTRSVDYARLTAGDYRFLVRAITRNGLISEPAIFEFRILPPFYLRWWFMTLTVLAVGALIYLFYRRRIARLLELERIRTRIASDLHDDIGSNLSLIAGLSEVMREKAQRIDSSISENLSLVADVSRKSVDAMSDIVWAVNPQKDHLRDLVQRMRRFASDSFTAHDIEFTFFAPDSARNIKLGTDTRREVFLIFKECINNVVRHSQSDTAEIILEIERRSLRLTVSDNGQGFDPNSECTGQGLSGMKKRAEKLGGELLVVSANRLGTSVTLTVSL